MIRLKLSLLFSVSLFLQSVNAQTVTDSLKVNEIRTVTVLGSLTSALTLPIVVVDKSVMDGHSFFTPADALRRETGISLSRDGIWATSVNVRGLSEQRLLFLVDGDRIQTASDVAGALSTIDISNLKKIEVIKGASSVLYGTGAMGGIVNFVSERPTYTPTPQLKGSVGTEFNTVNNLWATSAYAQFTSRQWYLALNGSFRTAQNIQTPSGILSNSQFHDASWGLKGGIMYSPNEEVLVNYQHFGGWDIGLPGGSAFPATSTVRYKSISRNQLSGEYIISDINENLRKVSLKAYTQDLNRDVENIVNPSTTILPTGLNQTYGAKLTSDWHFTDYHNLVLGAEGWERKSESARQKIVTPSDTISTVIGEQPTPNAKMLDLGVFAHYSWKLVPKKWMLNAGLRFDYIRTANDTAFNPIFKYTVTRGVKKYVTNLARTVLFESAIHPEFSYAAHVDLDYNLSQYQSLSLSLANSYRVASIEERFKFIDLGATAPLKVGNPNLKPEKGTFVNMNYTLSSNKFRLKTDFFVNYLFDLITEKAGIFEGRSALINTNINKSLFLGAEVEANWNINDIFSVLANASYTRARDVDANSALPQIPPISGFASFNYHSGKLLEASFSTDWAARQSEIAVGETITAGHIIFNFDLHSTPIQFDYAQLQLFAGVDNFLNTAYYNHLTSVRNGGALYYEQGRNVYVKAKLNF